MLDKLKAFWTIVKAQIADIWNKSKMYLIAIAGIVFAIEWRRIKEALMVYSGSKEIAKDKKEDTNLATQEKTANQQAETLIQKANQEGSQNPTVTDDWNKS